jgi:hypothetical protein
MVYRVAARCGHNARPRPKVPEIDFGKLRCVNQNGFQYPQRVDALNTIETTCRRFRDSSPSQPKETEVRQGIPAKSHGHRPVTVAEEARRREDVEPGAGEERIEGHKKSGGFVTAN